jgi:hypothetical protein
MQGIFIPCGVGCRTQPIGIRMALGAHRCDIFALIMRQRAMQTALTVAIGSENLADSGERSLTC